jgi:outer membrane protein OmpA-like peptidoglycan-associated protein
MRTFLMQAFVITSVVVGISACGGKENRQGTTAVKPATPVTATDQAQKVALSTPVASEAAPVTETEKPPRFTLVLEDKAGFKFNSSLLTDEAKARIDEIFTGGKVDLKDAHFEIEGYTDNLGSKIVNEKMGLRRADAVRQYIVEKYEVPMECISVISFGMEKPVADNSTQEGRSQNRRVVLKVVD